MMNNYGYVGFYNQQRVEVHAKGMWEAKEKVVRHFKVPKSKQGLVAVVLAERPDGTAVPVVLEKE
jgi:hypothetical protein